MKNKKGQIAIAFIIMVIFGVVLVNVITAVVSPATESQFTSENLTTTDSVGRQLTYNGFINTTLIVHNGSLNLAGNWTAYTNGTFYIDCEPQGCVPGNGFLTYNYSYYADAYVTNGTTRTIVALFTVLYCITLLVMIVTAGFKKQ